MGKGAFTEEIAKQATLDKMKQDGVYQNAINWLEQSEGPKADPGDVIELAYCVPNCVKKHEHNFMYDYSKCYKDPITERPGECFELNQDPNMCRGTPINIESATAIKQDFEDSDFKCNYEVIDPKASYKFNQSIESYFFPLKTKNTTANYLNTATISLFDKHIPNADFFGQQFHFHSPAEHSIDGKLMDLEMHIVHFIDPAVKEQSQFFAGVLGFMFKVMPDDYFAARKSENPDILYHDEFLQTLVDEEKHRGMAMNGKPGKQSPLNLDKFVKLIDFNKRFTYQGSLTTAPLVEGILWNLVDTVIPIKQTTMDQYTDFRRV